METASLLATEGPIALGYLAVAAAVGLTALLVAVTDTTARATRRRNRRIRHARAGCGLCRQALDAEAIRADVAAREEWLDYPTARNTTA